MRYGIAIALLLTACTVQPSSNDIQRDQQERIVAEGTSQVGMPAIKNFRERKLLKDIYELRDQDALVTYTYVWSEYQAKMVFFCDSIGYGIPYSTQFTAGETVQRYSLPSTGDRTAAWGSERLPQSEPNGLFSPASAEGTWVMCKDPNGKTVQPVYTEPRIMDHRLAVQAPSVPPLKGEPQNVQRRLQSPRQG